MEASKNFRSSLCQKSLYKYLPLSKGWHYQFWWQKNANIFKNVFGTLADDLLANLPPPSLRFGWNSVQQYYEKNLKCPKSKFNVVSEGTVLKFLQDLAENKAAGLDNLSGKFLKDGATSLGKPISWICNLSINYSIFPSNCKIGKLKLLFKNGSKTDPKNYRPSYILISFSF